MPDGNGGGMQGFRVPMGADIRRARGRYLAIENPRSAARIQEQLSVTLSIVPTGLVYGVCKPRTASWAKVSRP
jgi:hypothetical protein